MSQKDLKVRVGADTSLAEKQIDKLQDQNITIAVDVDLEDVQKALKTISGLTSKISNAFGDKFTFSGLQKSIDDIDKRFGNLIKKTSKGISYIDVNPMGLDELKENISTITTNIKELNGAKLDLKSFERLADSLSNIESIVHSIMTGLDFDKIRSVSQVQKDIDETTKQLEGLSDAQKELQKFEKRLSGPTARNIFSRVFMNGKVDVFDAEDLSKWLGYLKEYKKLGGDLSKIKIDHIASKLKLPKDVIRSWEQYKKLSEEDFDVKFNKLESFYKDTDVKTLQDIYDLLVMIKHIDHDTFLDDAKISGDMVGAGEKAEQLTTQLSLLNKELDKAQAREHKLNVSLDTGSVEEFTKAITTALQAVGDFNLKIPEDFSFEGLSPESLNSIIGKLEEIAKTIRDIGTLLSTGVDVSNLHIKELGVDVHPQVDKAEFVKQIEDQLNGSVIDVKASVKLSGETQDSAFQLVDNAMITGAKTEFKNITNDFGHNLQVEISSIKDNLTDIMKSVKYETLFESLRSTLLDIVVQFQNSLNNVSFSKEQTGEIYKLLHEWQEASNILSRTGKDSERAALLNQSTGSVSNSYLYDKETGFSGRILAELNRLSAGVSGEIRELYDTWLHSHPFREELQGLKTIGSDIGFTPEDFEVYRNRYLKQGVANMMVANNGKYTNINWDGISEEIMNKVIRNFKASDIWNNGAFVGKLAQENGIYNFDKQSNQINNAIIKAMQSAGISDAEQRVKVGNIEDLKVDMSALHQEEQKASEEAQELIEVFRQLGTVLDSFSGESFKFGISEESLDGIINKLNEVVEAINKIADLNTVQETQPNTSAQEQYEREAKAIEEVIAAEQKLDNEQKDHVDNSQEITSMQNLADRVDTVTTAVDFKTRAFQEEEQIVVGTVQREISSLELLDGQLTEIVNTLDKIKTASSSFDFNFLINVNADNGLNKLLSDLNEQVKVLDIESLSKLSGAIQGLKTTITTAENLEMVAVALKEFKESLSGISVDDNNFLSSINSILSKKDELQNLCKILESSSEKIKEVQNAANKGTGKDSGIGKNTREDAEKASKAVKELKDDIESLYGSLRKSIKDRESKNIFGTEHFIDDLMEVSKKYKSIQELRASNKSLISDQDMQSIEEYFAKFKMSAGDFVGNIDQTNKTSEFIEQLNQAKTQLESVKAVLDKVKSGEAFTEEDITKVKEFISQIRNLNSVERDRSNNFADTTKVNKLLGNIADDLRKHSMTKELREEYELLQNEIKSFGNNLPTDKLKEFESTYANLNRRMKEGKTGLSFFDGIIKKARTMSQNFIAMYFSLYDIIRYIRTGVTYIKDLDTAFTEMRKVSDESTKSLKNFQNESFDIANAVGTTAKQIQNSTADWMGEILVPLYGNI